MTTGPQGGNRPRVSRLAEFHLYDIAVLTSLTTQFREARGKKRALRRLVEHAEEPRFAAARDRDLRATLKRFRALKAPELLIENCRRELEPRAFLLERLEERGQPLAEWELYDLALRSKKAIPAEFDFVEWLADHDARTRGPTPDMTDGWVQPFSSTAPGVRDALFGSKRLDVGGVPTLGADRCWVHDLAALARARRFFEALVELSPPPLEQYRRWYPHLHAMRFAMGDNEKVPADGPLAWEYATELAAARRAITRVVSMLKNCERRGWCVQVCCE